MRSSVVGSASIARPLQWSFPTWFLPFWVGAVGWQWWKLCLRELELSHPAGGHSLSGPALAGTIARLAGLLIESGFYVLLWAGLGHRLRFWRFASWLLSISMVEVLAESMRLDLRARGGGSLRDAILLGPIVRPGLRHTATGALAVFGAAGISTGFRIAWSAAMQARALGLSLVWPLAATAATWLMTRGALWMIAELLRGRSS